MSYRFTYFFIGIGFTLLWLGLFSARKDTRKEMLVMSIIFGILGPIANSLFIIDWWTPLTLEGTGIGFFESVFVGFTVGGVTGVLYEAILRKKYAKKHLPVSKLFHLLFFLMVPVSLGIFFGGFYLLNLNSFIASSLALLAPTLVILSKRPDLIKNSLVTGALLVFVSVLVYNFVELLTPGWIQQFWLFQNTPAIVILNMPIDDMFHYFFLGMFGGPLYEYWVGLKLVDKKD